MSNSFVVDSAHSESFETAKKELFDLLTKPSLQNIPLLVLANKNDIQGAKSAQEIIDALYVFQNLFASLLTHFFYKYSKQ